MPVFFHFTDAHFNLKEKNSFKKWINSEILRNPYKTGRINIIFCSDDYLLEINRKHLDHDYYTDIITFNFNDGKIISGDLFISVDRIKENSLVFKSDFKDELKRVIIHGVLHLLGNDDHTTDLKRKIHVLEDEALSRFPHS